jgi:hypothetical protein
VDPLPGWYPDAQSATPGWYPDPQQPAQLRYWDGEVWTASVAPPMSGAMYGPPAYGAYAPPETNGLAVASLVCSLAGFFACGVPTIVGVVLGHVARGQIRRSEGRQTGDGLALAGLIVGYLMIAGFICLILLIVIGSGDN